MSERRTAEVRGLCLRVPGPELDALYAQLRAYRDEGEYGVAGLGGLVPFSFVDDLLAHWTANYDWRPHEARLNMYDHFATRIAGQFVHFLHIRSSAPLAVPVLLTHEWPSGVVDVLDAAAPLEATGAHHLVIPSISWSALTGPGDPRELPSRRTAAGWAELMSRLHYEEYLVGDDQSGIESTPAYTVPVELDQPAPTQGLSSQELGEVRWFNENLTAFNQRQQIAALVMSTALLCWNSQLVNAEVDRDAIITGVLLAWFAARLAADPDQDTPGDPQL